MLNILEHPVLNEMLHDGRRIRIMDNYFYLDPQKRQWDLLRGDIVNGADKPRLLWTLSGGPYIGKERIASMFHDKYCDSRVRPHTEVHTMFWFLMMDLGVSEGHADRLWFAVDRFGPKWDEHGHDQDVTKEEKAFMDSAGEEW